MLKEKDLDIVLIATPDHWHALPMIAAVEAGADVYVQKPISVDVVEGQAMVAAARKHKPRRAGRHPAPEHAAPDRGPRPIIKRGQARQDRPRRDLLLLPHAGPRAIRPTPPRRSTSTTRCGPARRRCGRTTRSSIRAAGGRSWSTATASSATCASTCSTWCAGCSTWAGRSASSSDRRHPGRQGEQGEHHRHADGHLRFRRPRRRLAAPHLGRPGRSRSIPGARRFYGDKGTLKAERARATTSPRSASGKPVHKRRDVSSWSKYPEDKTEKDLEKHVAPAIRGHMLDFLAGDRSRAASRWPTSSRATSRRPAASWPTCRMQLGRTLTWDADNGQRRRRRRGQPAAPPALSRTRGSTRSRETGDGSRGTGVGISDFRSRIRANLKSEIRNPDSRPPTPGPPTGRGRLPLASTQSNC